MRDFVKTSALFLGLAGCGDGINDISPKENDNEAPPRVIMRVSSAPGKIRGTTEVEGSTVQFSAEEGAQGRHVVFAQEDGEVLAAMSQQIGEAVFVAARVRWDDKDSLTADERSRLEALGGRPEAGAIAQTAAHIFEKLPEREAQRNRIALIRLYAELAEFIPEKAKRFKKPRGNSSCILNRCQMFSPEAVFGCPVEVLGKTHNVSFLLDGAPEGCDSDAAQDSPYGIAERGLHEKNECYGSCGWGCGGECQEIPIRCELPDISEVTDCNGSRNIDGISIYSLAKGDYTLDVTVGTWDRDPLNRDKISPADNFVPGNGPGEQVASLLACVSAECCYEHDECNRHDIMYGLDDYLICQDYGARNCGVDAMFGEPLVAWNIKWFSRDGIPLLGDSDPAFGRCKWRIECDNGECVPILAGYDDPPEIDHADFEQSICPVHGCRHAQSGGACLEEGNGRCISGECEKGEWCFPSSDLCRPCIEPYPATGECDNIEGPDSVGSAGHGQTEGGQESGQTCGPETGR